jgi:hypothetical protein
MAKALLKSDDPEQSKCFIEMVEELGTDLSPDGFDRVFAKVAAAKRQPAIKSQTKRKNR